MATPGNSMATPENISNMLILLLCNSGNTGNSKILPPINNYKEIPVTPRAYRFFTVAAVAAVATVSLYIKYIIILNIYKYILIIFLATASPILATVATATHSTKQQNLTL